MHLGENVMNTTSTNSVLAVIPARFASTRFPGKVIAPLAGKPLVVHTYERTREAQLVDDVVVATDDARVADALAEWNVPCVMTRPDHPAGTDRIAEVAEGSTSHLIVNVQGDEPLIDPATIDSAVQAMLDAPEVVMATARHKITEARDIADSNCVKVVCDNHGRALYFSRSPIPAVRDEDALGTESHWLHIGLYVYRRDFLIEYARMAPTPLEKLEKLEQLRVLENGYSIAVVDTEYQSIGVDSPADLERVRTILEAQLAK